VAMLCPDFNQAILHERQRTALDSHTEPRHFPSLACLASSTRDSLYPSLQTARLLATNSPRRVGLVLIATIRRRS
jgi:hypothetical protein